MAAKKPADEPGLSPEVNNGKDFRGNTAYSVDMGVPDKAFSCASCHSAGILEFDRESGKRHDEISDWKESDGSGF
ncbi:MAG: hypothetical protein ABGX12_03135, partial [Desulfurobacteriaceae bacterium]